MTIINKSMFPVRSGFQNITMMKARFDVLQGQLATGNKHANLADMGMQRYSDLSMRARIEKIAGYQSNITTVDLRLDLLDKTMARFDTIEADQRTLAVSGAYGSSNVNFATTPEVSRARLDEVLNLLNVDLAGRYLMGGSTTDREPVKMIAAVLDGEGGRAGFKTVVNERKLADAGADGLGRLTVGLAGAAVTVADDTTHPFGFKLSELSTNSTSVAVTPPGGVAFTGVPNAGESVTFKFALPDGTDAGITLRATDGAPELGQFQRGVPTAGSVTATQPSVATAAGTLTINGQNFAIPIGADANAIAVLLNANPLAGVAATVGTGADAGKLILTGATPTDGVNVTQTVAGLGIAIGSDPALTEVEATAENFKLALEAEIRHLVGTELAAASTYTAAENFFNGAGEPVLRVDGNPQTATALRVATPGDTVHWYSGETSAIGIDGLGRLNSKTAGATTVLRETAPVASGYGFRLTGISAPTASITTADAGSVPNALTVAFTAVPAAGETVTITITAPDGSSGDLALKAVSGNAGLGEFTIGATAADTAANFDGALQASLKAAATDAASSARDSVVARIDDASKVAYGVRANESGLLELVRTLASMAVSTYASGDDTSNGRFDAMASRQTMRLSEGHNNEAGSIEIISVELGLAKARTGSVAERLTIYDAQLKTMLEGIEGISKEEVAMEMLALQTRLQASYQATSLIAQLSLVNYI